MFKSKEKKITKNLNFQMSGQKIKIKTNSKYLGVILDDNLNFNTHFDII